MMHKMKREQEEKKRKDEEKKKPKPKVKPPFPGLQAFNVTGIILSLYGYDDDVKNMMQLVSNGTRKYFRVHYDTLSGFLEHWPPSFTGVIEFGDNKWNWDPEYPSPQQLSEFPKYRKIKWTGFRYRQNNNIS